jgi:hypothetical protein
MKIISGPVVTKHFAHEKSAQKKHGLMRKHTLKLEVRKIIKHFVWYKRKKK